MAEKKQAAAPAVNVQAEVDALVAKAQVALEKFVFYTQEQVDAIVKAMAMAGLDNHMKLAKLAVEETGRGVYEDKITKNMFATEYIYHSIKYNKTVGVVDENEYEDYEEIAEPVGIVAGVTPVTNPTSTTMFKAIICMKTRNPIIFGFHPSAQGHQGRRAGRLHPVDRAPRHRGDQCPDESSWRIHGAGHGRRGHGQGGVFHR